ncbi:MAG: DNA methyltransferase [Bryobacterales bacterium]|nr:DNA methyltransferase [Bryobacterales bacterium]
MEEQDPKLAADLKREVAALSGRRRFGLNFERHIPETVELPGRPVRRGDKVRFLPKRGEKPRSVNRQLWRVDRIRRTTRGRVADLVPPQGKQAKCQATSRSVDDLVVVAEFRDPIYPGMVSTGKVERGGDRPFHTVINAENFHALQILLFTHEGNVDAIYIDPPYNTGSRDWKYNNDYVDSDDAYRHSKWLAMMERRLKLAKCLLNPAGSALIVAIDEREVHRLALLLEQVFEDAEIQMVTSVISAKGVVRPGKFSRVEEHLFVVAIGGLGASPWMRNMLEPIKGDKGATTGLEWLGLRRREPTSVRGARPNQFYPVFVDKRTNSIHSIGDAVKDDVDRRSVAAPVGTRAVWPLKPDRTEMLWGLTPEALRRNWKKGFVRVSRRGTVQYLQSGTIAEIADGTITVTGRSRDGSVRGTKPVDDDTPTPKRVWNLPSHNAETGGTRILSRLVPGRRFPYPKSLYAVEDVLRFFVGSKPNAIVLDFFAGSGTSAHAVIRLNRQDGGCRQCICITNNEVSPSEEIRLRKKGLCPGDVEWEQWGICEYVTKPRIEAAITGATWNGEAVEGAYGYTDEFALAEGFEENVEFFTVTYEAPRPVAHNRAFKVIAPLLWMRAGSKGRRIEKPSHNFHLADTYAVLFDLDASRDFLAAVAEAVTLRIAFIVTDDDRGFQAVCGELPGPVEAVRLYESYLTNFTINTGRR